MRSQYFIFVIFNLLVYYSTVKERATVERLFYEDDMCMIYNMKMGRLYNRWMGTITLSNNGNKCVVISTVSGENFFIFYISYLFSEKA